MTARRLGLLCAALLAACSPPVTASDRADRAPIATLRADEPAGLKHALFAGGCYWGVEGVFSHVRGVTSAVSGFHGGASADADYDRVSAGRTAHAETVRVTYDPAVVRYDQLLRVFFSVIADPTQLNRQGPDVGRHYRNALIPLSPEQRRVATAYLGQLRGSGLWDKPLVTRIEAHRRFYPGPAYHQDFMLKNPRHGYILAWDVAKVNALKRLLPEHYKRDFTPE